MPKYIDELNKKKFDQTLIRFPKGTLLKFRELFGDLSFNGWVVALVSSRLVLKEFYYPNSPLPFDEDPSVLCNAEILTQE